MHTNLHSMINSTLINSTLINSTLGEERTLLSRQQKQAEQGGGGTFRISVKKGSKHACWHTYLSACCHISLISANSKTGAGRVSHLLGRAAPARQPWRST